MNLTVAVLVQQVNNNMCDICQSYPCLSRCPNYKEKKVGECQWCGNDIYDRCEIFQDNEGNIFCSKDCAIDFHGIKELDE